MTFRCLIMCTLPYQRFPNIVQVTTYNQGFLRNAAANCSGDHVAETGRQLVSLVQPVFATCHHNCKVIEADILNLSRHYKKYHQNVNGGKRPGKATIISDDEARRIVGDKRFEKKFASREIWRMKELEKQRVETQAGPISQTSTSPPLMQQSVLDANPFPPNNITYTVNNDCATSTRGVNEYEDEDTAMDLDTDEVLEEKSPQVQKVSTLLSIPTEIRDAIISLCITRELPCPCDPAAMRPEMMSTGVLWSNQLLRIQTLNLLSKSVMVVRLDVHYTNSVLLQFTEDMLARLPFFELPANLDHGRSSHKRIVSLEMSMHIGSVPAGTAYHNAFNAHFVKPASGIIRARTTRTFMFEIRHFRELVRRMQQRINTSELLNLTLTFTNRELGAKQQEVAGTILGMFSTIRGLPPCSILGLPVELQDPQLIEDMCGPPLDGFQERLRYFFFLLSRTAKLLSEGKFTEAYYEALAARKAISHRVLSDYLLVEIQAQRPLLYQTYHLAYLAIGKTTLAICAQADQDGNLSSIPESAYDLIMKWWDDDDYVVSAFPQEYRAEAHAAIASASLFRAKAEQAGQRDYRYSMANGMQHLYVAIALGHAASTELWDLLQYIILDRNYPIDHAMIEFCCVSQLGPHQKYPEQELLWEPLQLTTKRPDNGRRPIWYGLQSDLGPIWRLQCWTEMLDDQIRQDVIDGMTTVMDMEVWLPKELGAAREDSEENFLSDD